MIMVKVVQIKRHVTVPLHLRMDAKLDIVRPVDLLTEQTHGMRQLMSVNQNRKHKE